MSTKKNALGRGLTALLQDNATDPSGRNAAPVSTIAEIAIANIEANPFQPRKEFEEAALEELSESIKLHGVIQPITVRKVGYGKYEIISGERRTRASLRAGLQTIPAYVRVANDQGMLEMALIENIHREELNPIEISHSYQRLLEECSMKQEELSERVGKNRSTVTNYLRLLRLPEEIQLALRDNQVSMGHARALLSLDDKAEQLAILDRIIDDDLSVREVEALVKAGKSTKGSVMTIPKKAQPTASTKKWETELRAKLNAKVRIRRDANGAGEMVLPFLNDDALEALVARLNS